MDLEINRKTALVTGASKGIGRAVTKLLAAEGCDLHIASRTEADLVSLRNEIISTDDVEVIVHPVDLSTAKGISRLVKATGNIDILVNNAGAIPAGDIERLDYEKIKQAWDLKVFGYLGLVRAFYTQMRENNTGVIVNIIGMAGERPRSSYIAGGMGNAALMAMTRALGSESIDYGVRIVGINPGPIETDRLVTQAKTAADMNWGDDSRWRETLKGLPGDRAGSVEEEIAWLTAFLASPKASWLSGTVVMADGGEHSRPPGRL